MIRILVIDDFLPIGKAVRAYLRSFADVLPVTDPADALARLRAGERFDVVLCDMELGESTGADFEGALRAEFPELLPRLGFLTGGAVSQEAARFLEAPDRVIVQKPFADGDLYAAIRRLLARGS